MQTLKTIIETQPISLLPLGLILAWIGMQILWDNIYRPLRINNGHATASFNNILGRVIRFMFIEDSNPALVRDSDGKPIMVESPNGEVKPKLKYPKLSKVATWKNVYLLGFSLTILSGVLHHPATAWIFATTLLTIATRASKVFAERYNKLQRMLEVASVNLSYPRDAHLNPWQWIRVKNWENLTQAGETHVHYPAKFKGGDQNLQRKFETHFNDTITKDNTWVYEWESEKSMVAVIPVPPIPNMAYYPGSSHRKWNEIPIGVTAGSEAIWDVKVNPHALLTGTSGSGKSTLQRSIIAHCVQFPNEWRFVGIDVKRVELSPYKKYEPVVMGVALDVADGTEIIRYAKEEMMNRYDRMEKAGVTNFMDLPEKMHALMIMVDETYMFLATSGNKTDEGKEEDALKGESSKLIGEIARLGRAAGVHLVLATQRPDAVVIYGELKQNLAFRIAAGKADTIASQMTLDSDEATKLPGIKGRGYYQGLDSSGEPFQGYYAEQDWIDHWLADDKDYLRGWKKNGNRSTSNESDTAKGGLFSRFANKSDIPKKPKQAKKTKEKKESAKKLKKLKALKDSNSTDLLINDELTETASEDTIATSSSEDLLFDDSTNDFRQLASAVVEEDDFEEPSNLKLTKEPLQVAPDTPVTDDFDNTDDLLIGFELDDKPTPVKPEPKTSPKPAPVPVEDDVDDFGNIRMEFNTSIDEDLFAGFDFVEDTVPVPPAKPTPEPTTKPEPVKKASDTTGSPVRPSNAPAPNNGRVAPSIPSRPVQRHTRANGGASQGGSGKTLPPRPQRPKL